MLTTIRQVNLAKLEA